MIKKIKQAIIFSFGAFFAFLFKCTEVSAQMPSFGLNTPAYGTDYTFAPPPTIWEKVLSVVLTPVTIVIIIILLKDLA